MITLTATGFLAAKPELVLVGDRRTRKCRFTIVDRRSAMVQGERQTVYERAVFVAWDDAAEKIASTLDKGSEVTCIGWQETSRWTNGQGVEQVSVEYRLADWRLERRHAPPTASGPTANGTQGDGRGAGRPEGSRQGERPVPPERKSAVKRCLPGGAESPLTM